MADIHDESGEFIEDESGQSIEDEAQVRTYSGAAAPSGTISRLLNSLRKYSSGISFVGTLTASTQSFFTYTASGAKSFAGAVSRLLASIRTYAGSLSPTGTISRWLTAARTKAGALSISGALSIGRPISARLKSGVLSISGALKAITGQAVYGAISFSGRVWQETPLYGIVTRLLNAWRTLSSDLNFTGTTSGILGEVSGGTIQSALNLVGALTYYEIYSLTKAGTASFAGAVTNAYTLLRTTTGAIANSGAVTWTRAFSVRTYSGAVSFSSTLLKGFFKTYTGALTFAGSVSRSGISALYTATGVLTSAGAAARASVLARTKAAALSFSTTISGVKSAVGDFYWGAASGVLTITGTVLGAKILEPGTVSGIFEVIGRITIIDAVIGRLSDASVSPAGSFYRNIVTTRSTLSSGLSFVGSLVGSGGAFRSIQSALTFAGSVSGAISNLRNYTASGAISIAGAVTNAYLLLRTYTSGISFSGALTRICELLRTYSGGVSFAGITSGLFTSRDWKIGYLNFSSSVSRFLVGTGTAQQSSLAFAGGVSKAVLTTKSVSGVLGLQKGMSRTREILYMGPPNF